MEDYKKLRESPNVELKTSHVELSKDVYETYSAFANTSGGTIYLGIKEGSNGADNEIVGVANPSKQIDDLFNTLHNVTKISACIIGSEDVETIDFEGKTILAIHVPECSRIRKPIYLNGNVAESYVRTKKGDYLANEEQRRAFLMDHATIGYDLMPNPMGYGFSDVDLDTLHAFRQRMNLAFPNNRFLSADDESFLKGDGCFAKDDRGNDVLTIAATLMFTDYYKIKAIFPHYAIEYRESTSFSSKWEDRVSADSPELVGNLYSLYELLFQKMKALAPKPYLVENGIDIGGGLFDDALRELLTNAFSNAQFALDDAIRILANRDFVLVYNPGRLKVGLEQALLGGVSRPRNDGVMTLFRICGRSDKGGTGIPNIFDLAKKRRLKRPVLIESSDPESTQITFYFGQDENQSAKSNNKEAIFALIASKGSEGISIEELMTLSGYGYSSVYRYLKELSGEGRVIDNGKATNGKKYFCR